MKLIRATRITWYASTQTLKLPYLFTNLACLFSSRSHKRRRKKEIKPPDNSKVTTKRTHRIAQINRVKPAFMEKVRACCYKPWSIANIDVVQAISTGRTAAPRENRPTAPQGGSAPTYFQPNWGVANHIVNNRGISPIQEQAYPNSTTSQGEIAPNTHPGHYRPNRAASGLPPYQIQPNQSLSASQGPINNDYLAYNQPAQAISSNDTPGRLAGRVPIQNPAYARAIGQGRMTRNDIPGSHSTPRGVPSPTPSVALRRLSTPGPELTPLPPPPRYNFRFC